MLILRALSLLERKRLCLQVGRVEVATGCKALQRSKKGESTDKCTGACLDLQFSLSRSGCRKLLLGKQRVCGGGLWLGGCQRHSGRAQR